MSLDFPDRLYQRLRARKRQLSEKVYYVFNNCIPSKDFLVIYLQVINILQEAVTSA